MPLNLSTPDDPTVKQAAYSSLETFRAVVIELLALIKSNTAGALVPALYDFVEYTYTGDNVHIATYKLGGASGDTVATLTYTYENGLIKTITRT